MSDCIFNSEHDFNIVTLPKVGSSSLRIWIDENPDSFSFGFDSDIKVYSLWRSNFERVLSGILEGLKLIWQYYFMPTEVSYDNEELNTVKEYYDNFIQSLDDNVLNDISKCQWRSRYSRRVFLEMITIWVNAVAENGLFVIAPIKNHIRPLKLHYNQYEIDINDVNFIKLSDAKYLHRYINNYYNTNATQFPYEHVHRLDALNHAAPSASELFFYLQEHYNNTMTLINDYTKADYIPKKLLKIQQLISH